MNETQKRIKEYVKRLPGLKAKVMTAAMLLMVAAIMVTSASFAWVTLSRAPEITNVSTTISGNGNLEVALVPANGDAPAESQVGDGNKDILERNLTWGNLINLNDARYGLDSLSLRPARLNEAALSTNPLYGAEYGNDGRVTKLDPNFAYSTWGKINDQTEDMGFVVKDGNNYGVRAISSVKYDTSGANYEYQQLLSKAVETNLSVANGYNVLTNNQSYMQTLATLMGLYMTARMNPDEASLNNPTVEQKDILNMYNMYSDFLDVLNEEAEALAALCNLEQYLERTDNNQIYTDITAEDIKSDKSLSGFVIAGTKYHDGGAMLAGYRKDRKTIETDKAALELLAAQGSVKWKDSGINTIVDHLVIVGSCTIGDNNTPISSIGASNAASYLSGTQKARITNGILLHFEERAGGKLEVKNMGISAKVKRMGITIPATVKANITTSAWELPTTPLFTKDVEKVKALSTGFVGGTPVAKDTYGLAVDVWVRTNSDASFLKLEGNVLIESEQIKAVGTDDQGNEVDIYTYTYTVTGKDEEGNEQTEEITLDVYKKTVDGAEKWFHADTHGEVEPETTPVLKMITKETVIGYEGENRIWDENAQLSSDSTTQGAGSCYVFYADTPDDQARSLNLLQAMEVAFIDEEGTLLATAEMDVEHFFAENGRVTVPLVLDSTALSLGVDEYGEEQRYITALEKNVPKRITALIYLDGLELTNQEVLAAAEIQGQLNIQFGSTRELEHAEDETLMNSVRTVTATVDPTKHTYSKSSSTPMTSKVTVTVTGEQPKTLTGFFLRAINSTQGSREEKMTFTNNGNGTWTADYTFTVPGNYVLRTLNLDGTEYKLAVPPTVEIEGFAIASVLCSGCNEQRYANIITAENFYDVDVTMTFAAKNAEDLPTTAVAQFMHESGSVVNVPLQYNANTTQWTGSATLLNSGQYILQYVVLDGFYQEIDVSKQYTIDLSLGMRAAVYTISDTSFLFSSAQPDFEENLGFQLEIFDNNGDELEAMSDVTLFYSMQGNESVDEAGLIIENMKWNAAAGYYEGEAKSKVGIFKFGRVEVGNNIINKETTSPVFTIMSPEPPEYYDHAPDDAYTHLANAGQAAVSAQFTNASAAKARAIFTYNNGTEKIYSNEFKQPTLKTENDEEIATFSFDIPFEDADGTVKDGIWKLVGVELINVYDASGNGYFEENPYLIEEEFKNTPNITVINTSLKLFNGKTVYGKDANGNITGTFLQDHPMEGFGIALVNPKDESETPIKLSDYELTLENVQATFTYTANSSNALDANKVSYGGYSSSTLVVQPITVTLTDNGDGTWVLPADAPNLTYAGKYTLTELTFTLKNETGSLSKFYGYGDKQGYVKINSPTIIEVYSVQPTVEITAISPTGPLEYDTGNNGTGHQTEKVTPSCEPTKATVYFECVLTPKCRDQAHIYTSPTVTIRLSDLTNYTKAELPFTGANSEHLYAKKGNSKHTDPKAYSWTPDSESDCLRFIGEWEYQLGYTEKKTPLDGEITATQLEVTVDGYTDKFVFDVPDITIYNPY